MQPSKAMTGPLNRRMEMELKLIEGEASAGAEGESKTQVFLLQIPSDLSPSEEVIKSARELILNSGSEELYKIFEIALARRTGKLRGDL